MTETTDRIVNPHTTDAQFTELSADLGKKLESSNLINRLKKFGKGAVSTVRTILMSKEKLGQQIEAAHADFEKASKDFHKYRLMSGNDTELTGITSRDSIMMTDDKIRLYAERFNAANETKVELEKQRFTRRIGRRALIAAGVIGGVVGGAIAAWQFKDAAFLTSAADHAQAHLTPNVGPELLPSPADIPIPSVEAAPVLPPIIAEEGDSYWGMAIERWQQNGVSNPDTGQINDVKNILMQHGPVNPHGWLLPGNAVDPNAAEAFIHNSIGVK